MSHESRLTRSLRDLLYSRRTAALSTLRNDGTRALPQASFVPFAIDPMGHCLVLHVSALAAHTRQMQAHANVALLIAAPEEAGQPVHALERVGIEGSARVLEPSSPAWASAREAYLARFPEAAFMTELGDFRFVAIDLTSARHVAGFGTARDVERQELLDLMAPPC